MRRLLFLGAFVWLFACKKEEAEPPSSVFEFKIKKPTPNEVFYSPSSIELEFEVNASTEIHGYEFELLDSVSQKRFKIQNEHLHQKYLDKRDTWSVPDTVSGKVWFKVTIFKDHEGNTQKDSVSFQIVR